MWRKDETLKQAQNSDEEVDVRLVKVLVENEITVSLVVVVLIWRKVVANPVAEVPAEEKAAANHEVLVEEKAVANHVVEAREEDVLLPREEDREVEAENGAGALVAKAANVVGDQEVMTEKGREVGIDAIDVEEGRKVEVALHLDSPVSGACLELFSLINVSIIIGFIAMDLSKLLLYLIISNE